MVTMISVAPSNVGFNRTQLQKFFVASSGTFNVMQLSDWYNVTKEQLQTKDPHLWFEIKTRYNGSIYKSLMTSFPNHVWQPWIFLDEKVPPGFWSERASRVSYFEWLHQRLGYRTLEDWYNITKAKIRANNGAGLLMHYYGDNVRDFVKDIHPEHPWIVWKFARSPATWTRNRAAHREWLENTAKTLGFTSLDAWYNISTPQLTAMIPDDPVTMHYGHSLPKALRMCFPEHQWQDWRFKNVRRASIENQKRHLEHAAATVFGWEAPATNLDRWYQVKFNDLVRAGISGLITGRYESSLPKALRSIYPDHSWDEWRFEKLANRNTVTQGEELS